MPDPFHQFRRPLPQAALCLQSALPQATLMWVVARRPVRLRMVRRPVQMVRRHPPPQTMAATTDSRCVTTLHGFTTTRGLTKRAQERWALFPFSGSRFWMGKLTRLNPFPGSLLNHTHHPRIRFPAILLAKGFMPSVFFRLSMTIGTLCFGS